MRRLFVTTQQYSKKHKSLIINPFCHYFCSGKTKIPPKLSSFPTFDPELNHGAIDNQDFISAE